MMHDAVIWWRRPRLLAAIACVALGAALLAAGPLVRLAAPAAPPTDDPGPAAPDEPAGPPPAAATQAAPDLVVYVSGAVAAPDVYRLPAGARVKDAVLAAGGLTGDAAGEDVNLAAPLSDAQHIHVPRLGEAAPAPAAADTPAAGGLIDLNRAGAVDLEELPGVGQSIAERIVAYREQQGPFQTVADLKNVTGIGDKLFAKISPLVTVGP